MNKLLFNQKLVHKVEMLHIITMHMLEEKINWYRNSFEKEEMDCVPG